MKKSFIIGTAIFCSLFIAQSCDSLEQTTQESRQVSNSKPEVDYKISLSSVERPENTKEQFGETKITTFYEGKEERYHYEDDYINIVWYVDKQAFNFLLTNKTNHTIKINWDDVSFVDINGNVSRMMHSGVKYDDRNNSQPATSIPRNASLSDLLQPTDNVRYSNYGWLKDSLIPKEYRYGGANGKTFLVFMPIMIENVQNDYSFEFVITSNYEQTQTETKQQNNEVKEGKRLAIRFPETLSPVYNAFRSGRIYNMSNKDKAFTVQAFVQEIEKDLQNSTTWENLELINTKIKYLDQYSAIQTDLKDTVMVLKESLNVRVKSIGE